MTELDSVLESSGLAPLEVRLSGRRNVRIARSPSDAGTSMTAMLALAQ